MSAEFELKFRVGEFLSADTPQNGLIICEGLPLRVPKEEVIFEERGIQLGYDLLFGIVAALGDVLLALAGHDQLFGPVLDGLEDAQEAGLDDLAHFLLRAVVDPEPQILQGLQLVVDCYLFFGGDGGVAAESRQDGVGHLVEPAQEEPQQRLLSLQSLLPVEFVHLLLLLAELAQLLPEPGLGLHQVQALLDAELELPPDHVVLVDEALLEGRVVGAESRQGLVRKVEVNSPRRQQRPSPQLDRYPPFLALVLQNRRAQLQVRVDFLCRIIDLLLN